GDDLAGHCHAVAGHLPGGLQGLRDGTAHESDDLCLNLIEPPETPYNTFFDRGASAADGPTAPWGVACFFCHRIPPVVCAPLVHRRAFPGAWPWRLTPAAHPNGHPSGYWLSLPVPSHMVACPNGIGGCYLPYAFFMLAS